jgi:16S rRNA (cytosine1407-C5)-methyltransferase
MAPEENEAVIDYLLRSQPDALAEPFELSLNNRVPAVKEWNGRMFNDSVGYCLRLKPSKEIEAFFVCKLKKAGQTD